MADIFPRAPRWMDEDLVMFDEAVRRFALDKLTPERLAAWDEAGIVDLSGWRDAVQAGLLGLSIGTEWGGAGGDFRHEAVLIRRLILARADGFGIPLHNAICAPYIEKYGTEAQKHQWLPRMVSGELIGAIAMTEPGTGSDLQGIRTTAKPVAGGYVISGQKTFISNGQNANLVLVVARTATDAGSRNLSLFAVETGQAEGFRRGRNLDKVGCDMADTSELFFDDVFVPEGALLGGVEGQGMAMLMRELPKERLIIAVESLAVMEAALATTLDHVRERKAFGQRLLDFQNTQFRLAECQTEATIARAFVDDCIARQVAGELDATTASMAKYWVSERAQVLVDTCQQLFGGYGYMNEYPIARLYRDVRVKRIYGGTTEIMKLLIARSLDA
ncbi:acyl-CoA dehydrogenase family protein [Novosphingobium bradum]|uniref:Acyl-CoA dehydrogenase family protein n=1 Tax=Novosphingobium bradum TaxID=1737444 RepID=A0ABV7IN85_9SPHN